MDVFVETNKKHLKIKTNKDNKEFIALPFGSKVLIKDIHHHTGGGGTNTAITFSKLDLKTGFIGYIGKDHNGKHLKQELKKNKIKFLGRETGKTGYSVIIDSDGDRTILTYKGCNGDVNYSDKELKKFKAKYYYITSMTGKGFKFTNKLIEFTKNSKSKICFNPSSYLAKKGLNELREILKNTYCLILNSEEAELLTKKKSIIKNLSILQTKIVFDGFVVITDGARGAYAIHNNKKYFVSAKKINVKETTGAGDAFGSGFFAGLIKGKSIKFSLKMGINNSENVITERGAKNGLPGKELISLASKDNRKIKIL